MYQLTDHLGNVRAVIMKNGENAVSLTAKTDYYPFGMPMPNRNIEGNYRYKFQGQEKDAETGKEAFELAFVGWTNRAVADGGSCGAVCLAVFGNGK